ncbi:MAG TPA: hypothetical protein VFR04_09780 [Solirubrobacterales bacterium]|nr:hypothetical protein [Solirubrobacterales bacterium]
MLLAGVAAIAAIVAGCGSSDDDSTQSTADNAPTKPEFIKAADAICKQGDGEIEAGFEKFAEENNIPRNQEPSDAQGVEIVETVIVPNIQTQSELIRGLGAPEGDEKEVDQLLDSLDEAIEAAEEEPKDLLAEGTSPFGDVNQEAVDYGLRVCGQE